MNPKVSVIVPIYNAEKYLGQCLDSILMQTLENIEVLCIDDGSSDGSLSILQTYAMFDGRLKIITQENAGAGVARNNGLKSAHGEYITFVDADDFIEAETLEKMVAKAEEDQSDIVIAGIHQFNDALKERSCSIMITEEHLKQSPAKPEDFGKDLFSIAPYPIYTKLIRQDLIKRKNLMFDESVRFAEGYLFDVCALTGAKKISLLKDCLTYYRINHPTSTYFLSEKNFPDALKAMSHCYTTLKKETGEKFLDAFTAPVRRLLEYMLTFCSPKKTRENLALIQKEFPKEMFSKVFLHSHPIDVSIIIPVYNAAEFLPKCLESCINQTLKNIEIICVDDGSTDNSLEVLKQYAQKDNRIIVLHQENQRQSIARNTAMNVARGKYLQFLDADDFLALDASECLFLYSNLLNLDMCQLNAIHFGKAVPGGEMEDCCHLKWRLVIEKAVLTWKELVNFPYLGVAACLTFYDHDFLIKNKIRWINKKIAYEDTPFFIESILKAKRFGALNVPLYYRSRHTGSTIDQINHNLNEYVEIVEYTLDRIEGWSTKRNIAPYCVRFLETVMRTYGSFENVDKLKTVPYLYDLCYFVQKRYHFVLMPKFYAWCKRYLKDKPRKEKIKFYFYRLWACSLKNEYAFNLFSYKRNPFCIKIFGIPVLYTKILKKKSKKLNTIKQNVYLKFLGLSLCKIHKTS